MSQSFSSRAHDVRQQGRAFEALAAQGSPQTTEALEKLVALPRHEAAHLGDSVASMCEGRSANGDAGRRERLEAFGSAAVRYLGLTFSNEVINSRIVPALIEMVSRERSGRSLSLVERAIRYEQLVALGQLAPRMDEDLLDDALDASIRGAGKNRKFEPDLLLPLASFEGAFRSQRFNEDNRVRVRAQRLCLDSIRAIFEATVTAISEADQKTMSEVVSALPLTHTATIAWLTVLPSVAMMSDDASISKVNQVLDSTEWLLSRSEGFPGNFFGRREVESFDRVRSVLSLATGVLSLNASHYEGTIGEMRVAKREGQHRLGTVVLHMAQQGARTETIASMRDLIREELKREADPAQGSNLNREALMEVSALAWHLDVGDASVVHEAMQQVRDPRAQFYLAKALEGKPWE